MSFRSKLIFLVVLANLLLCGVVWQLVTGAQLIKKQIQLFAPAVGYLQGISAVSSALTRQTKEIVDYLILHNEIDKSEFIASSEDLETYFQLWRQSATLQQALAVEGEDNDLNLVDKTYATYQHWHKSLLMVIDLADKGDWNKALRSFQENWSSSLERQLRPAIDIALQDGLIEVEDAYHGLLLAIGKIPWGADENSILLEKIHTSMNFLIGGNQVNASVNTQFSMLVDYLLHSNEKSLQHFYRSQVIGDEALVFWLKTAEKKSLLETDLAKTVSVKIAKIETTYQRFSQQAANAIALKKSGQTNAALALVVKHDGQLIADFHNSISKAETAGAEALLTRVSAFRMTGLLLLALFLTLSSLLSLGMVKDMLFSLKTLNSGMTAIRAGDLAHRITLKKNDVMGTLAQTFNSMMDSLLQSQASLQKLTTELEQRVEDRTAQLASVNEDLEAFNAMVSHDLRSPLTSIYGYSQLLLAMHEQNSPQENSNTIDEIVAASESMSRIVSSLEELSQASQIQLSLGTVDLDALATKILKQFSSADPQRKVETLIDPVPMATGDQDLIEIALTNLLGNAWKYTEKTARAKIEFGGQCQAGHQVWYVRDNGAGFDMNNADQLFKTFGRLHPKKDFPGTGIGLSTVQRIIHRHGGEIWAEGKEGQGATFYFHFGQGASGPTSTNS